MLSAPIDEVPPRNVRFRSRVENLPRHPGAGGDLVTSHIIAVLSSVFPDGEAYFVRSVSAVRDEIDDPDLAERVYGFVGQESNHSREHRHLNRVLASSGYPTAAVERYVKWVVGLSERNLSPQTNLAVTAGLEHYTATIAEQLLGDPEARAQVGHEGVRELFMWHALEESEHKAVAFDVYQASGGGYLRRVTTMNLINLGFVGEIGTWTLISMLLDPEVRRHPLKALQSLVRLRHSPFLNKWSRRRILDYNRRGFHPNDHDTTGLVARWRAELFGSGGELSGLMSG